MSSMAAEEGAKSGKHALGVPALHACDTVLDREWASHRHRTSAVDADQSVEPGAENARAAQHQARDEAAHETKDHLPHRDVRCQSSHARWA